MYYLIIYYFKILFLNISFLFHAFKFIELLLVFVEIMGAYLKYSYYYYNDVPFANLQFWNRIDAYLVGKPS